MQNYDLLIDRIAKSADLDKEEVERRVEAKKAKLSGLISKEGAAQIIAAELGISFEDADLKVSELMPGMKKVNVVGKIIQLFPVRSFEKNGRSGKVANFVIADDTGSVRVVLWDTNHISLIEKGEVKEGDTVEVKNGSMRESEVHLSGFSDIKKSSSEIKEVKAEANVSEASLDEVHQGQKIKIRATVVQLFPPRFYPVCPECNKKAVTEGEGYRCLEHGKIIPKDRAILNFVVDDGAENIRVVMFSDAISLLIPEEDLKNEEKMKAFRDDFLGSEVYVTGDVRRNQLFNNLEIITTNVERVEVEKLVSELEAKS